jgi:hypothetical protein
MTLPWQDIITWLIVLGAVAYLARRWWPGAKSKAACHDGSAPGPAAVRTTGCSGSCDGCGAATLASAKTQTHTNKGA